MNRLADYSSRFRILKGGKVSLVISGLLLGSGLNGAVLTYIGDGAITSLTENSTLTISNATYNIPSGTANAAFSITNASTYSLDIINNGILNVTGLSTGINIYYAADDSSVTNNGTINLNSGGDGIYMSLKANDFIDNTANGNIFVNGSYGSYAISLVSDSLGGTVTNSGTITAKTNGELNHDAYSLFSFANTNAITVNNSGTMNGNIRLTKGVLNNTGTVSLPYNVNNSSGFIQTFNNSGTLEIGLLTNGSTTTYSQLYVGDIIFANNSTLKVNVLPASTNVSTLVGTTLNYVIAAADSITIDGVLNITDNSALLDFEYSLGTSGPAEFLNLTAVQAQSVGQTISGNNSNAQAAAGTLQTIVDNSASHSQMNGVVTALNGLSTNAQVEKAVDSTTPQTTTSSFTASNQISNNVANIIVQRQNVNLNAGGVNSGDELLAQKNLWVKPYGSMAKQSNKEGVNGFDMNAYGIGIGVDGEYAPDQKIGVGLFYTRGNVDVNNVAQTSDMDVYSFIVYGIASLIDDKTHLLYQAGYSWQDTASSRGIAFMGTSASADYTSKVASLDLKLLRDYKLGNDTLIQPLISTTYRYFKSPSYSESGAGALNLDVQEFSSNEFIVGAGALGYYQIDKASRIFGNVNVGYDVRNDDNIVSSAYQGASGLSFNTSGIDNGRWSYDAGFGYESGIDDASGVSLSYNLQGEGSGFINHVVSAKYTYKF